MGNYADLELDFVERTIRLIRQYTDLIQDVPFDEQLNYTLTINCLLGLIVMPKERVITYIPKIGFDDENRLEMGLVDSFIDESIGNLKDLVQNLRHSIAHFDIEVISDCKECLVDWIEFKGSGNQPGTIAKFRAAEIFPFLQYYAAQLSENMRNHRG
ncbi:MAG: hypothetical protein JJT87_00830 [Halomonas sp.]|nr:HEPN family nuclease [Halomonas sp.]MCC5900460.1 hypothetical protein [Halomonas sp.]